MDHKVRMIDRPILIMIATPDRRCQQGYLPLRSPHHIGRATNPGNVDRPFIQLAIALRPVDVNDKVNRLAQPACHIRRYLAAEVIHPRRHTGCHPQPLHLPAFLSYTHAISLEFSPQLYKPIF